MSFIIPMQNCRAQNETHTLNSSAELEWDLFVFHIGSEMFDKVQVFRNEIVTVWKN